MFHGLPLLNFYDLAWQVLLPRLEAQYTMQDMLSIVLRVTQYIQGASCVHLLLLKETMLTYNRRAPTRSPSTSFPWWVA